ncbi:MAG: exosortase B [Rubrivivax sp.]|nr:MAG: exosortase B [Rubrivivax sp.]
MTASSPIQDVGSERAAIDYPLWSLLVLAAGFLALFLPTYVTLADMIWSTDEQGHGPMILGASCWLLWSLREKLFAGPAKPAPVAGFIMLGIGVVIYVIGRSQQILEAEGFSQIPVLMGCMLLLRGWRMVRIAWFPLFFLLFMVPLPGALVQAMTLPLKSLVSYVAENLLYWAGYPVGRTGVMLTIGSYQLLVADACSGLNSLFTLEALGLLYMNIMNYKSKARNIALAVMIVPISFISNVTRVLALVLITFYLGDEVGQGFAHNFAGLILFSVALMLTYAFDRLLAARFDKKDAQHA